MTFAVASLARSWSIFTTPALIVFTAFSSSLPSVPLPDDIAFSALILAFALHALQLHFPRGPTPIFLLPFELCLPLCALLSKCIAQIMFPVLMLFLPILIITWSLAYLSLQGALLHIPMLRTLPAPMETRTGLFVILVVELLLLIPSLLTPLIMVPSLPQKNSSSSTWDRYSEIVGLEARKAFVQAVITYSTPHTFPPPFNLLQSFFQLPSALLRAHGVPSSFLAATERVLWRITVGPTAIVIAGMWWWGKM